MRLLHIYTSKRFQALFVVGITCILFIINAVHETYPDEFDNILGGWYILHGNLPYSGFFSHHGPFPYFLAAFIEIFSGQSFFRFRLVYAVFLVIVSFGTYLFLKKRLGQDATRFYPFFTVFLGILSTYYWLQMLLADNVAAFSFLPAYALITMKWFFDKNFTLADVLAVSVFSAISLYSSLTYSYLFVVLIIACLYLYYKSNYTSPFLSKRNAYPFFVLAIPHVFFLIYLLVTRSLVDYFYQNFTFNTLYYIYNYPKPEGSTFINPLRYAILIAHWSLMNFYTLLIGFKSFDFAFPVNMTMVVSNMGFFVFLIVKKQYKLAAFLLLVLIFTNVRSNPLTSKETDYQAGVYNLLSFFNMFFFLSQIYKSLNEKEVLGKKIIFSGLFLVVGLYAFFGSFHLLLRFNEKAVSKYMGTMPLIYDRPKIAPIANLLVLEDEYVWIGPFEFEELFYTKGKIPSKYHILISGVGFSQKIRQEMISDFEQNKPKVIFFDKDAEYMGWKAKDYSKHFLDFLDRNYVTLYRYKEEGAIYKSQVPIHKGEKLNLEEKMFVRRDKIKDVIQKLLEKNLIREEK